MAGPITMLFVCTGNSARSQMAEGFARHLGGGRVEAHSAGVEPSRLNPFAVRAMQEKGIDISRQTSKAFDEALARRMDVVITVCGNADERCPVLPPEVRRLHWALEDPAATGGTDAEVLAKFREIRDQIEVRVSAMLPELAGKISPSRKTGAGKSEAMNPPDGRAIRETSRWLHEAATAAKCWPCGCLHGTLPGLGAAVEALPEEAVPLREALARARERLRPQEYECLGCPECYPALAANAMAQAFPQLETTASCFTEIAVERPAWPPLPGEYHVLRFHAPVAICTLTDGQLANRLVAGQPAGVAIVGRLQTENLGIERIVQNVLSNPHIRFLVLCGPDSVQRVGHRPGQSLLALVASGLDGRGRIVGAEGKRPVIRKVSRVAVEAFRRQVRVSDLVGCVELDRILESVAERVASDPGPAEPFAGLAPVPRTTARRSDRLVLDAAGFFVILPDRVRHALVVEHYTNDGVLDHVLEGRKPSDLCATAIRLGLVTRLDHAAYLGQELARAEQALQTGQPFVQDAAPGEECPVDPVPPSPKPT